jgi:rfaE bifunctional protein nucleotidyltransferase chain/domain
MGAVVSLDELRDARASLKRGGKKVVFTNGVFDIIHRGHIEYLARARALGDALIVGVNSDASVRRIKGPKRPIVAEQDRAFVLSNLCPVSYVTLFEDDTPLALITAVVPDILVKGADWSVNAIVGKDVVEAAGGTVMTIEFVPDRSTTSIIDRVIERFTSS